MARGAEARRPTPRGFALRTASLLPLPVSRALLERRGARDLPLPALPRPRRAPQGNGLLVTAVDEEGGAARGGIDAGRTGRQRLVHEGVLARGRALRLMAAGRGRVDVWEAGREARTCR
jgi:hypothetical protein